MSVNLSIASASRKLKSYEKKNIVKCITRGIWANTNNKNFSKYALSTYLLGKEQGYISFLSALQRHGIISQIPTTIYIATTGHSRVAQVKDQGKLEFFQLKPKYTHSGVKWLESKMPYAMATAEKALLDCLYLSTRKGNRFSHFPELDLSNIYKLKFMKLLKEHLFSKPIHTAIEEKFMELLAREKA